MPKPKSAILAFILIVVFSIYMDRLLAQARPLANLGSLSGQVRDSSDMSALPQATIAVYKSRDTSLIKYQLGDLRGRFTMIGLPLDSGLTLIISYIGYNSFIKQFKITAASRDLTIPGILLNISNSALKEVVIRVPPVELRGDTIIFNADAFKSRKNAVIGDLMRDLPGFVIWGDGKMEVNGKSVSKVTVEGKVFFADDPRIALNNIPKTAVDQVQVTPDKNTQDTMNGDTAVKTVSVNITLKKNAKSGAFGKVGYGYGTDNRREGDFSLAVFTPKDQLSFTGSLNNTNRNTLSAAGMMAFSSYRSGLAKNPLFSNFDRSGITDQKSGGMIYNRDWNRHLKTAVTYNLNNNTNTIIQNSFSNTILTDSAITRQNYNNSINSNRGNAYNATINYRDSVFNTISLIVDGSNSHSENSSTDSSTSSSTHHFLNRTVGNNHGSSDNDNLNIGINYTHQYDQRKHNGNSKEDFDIKYQLNKNSFNGQRFRSSSLTPASGITNSIGRRYEDAGSTYTHTFNADYTSFGSLLGVRNDRVPFNNEIKYSISTREANVNDLNTATGIYGLKNQYLSNTNSFGLFTYTPSVRFNKSFTRSVAGRFINNFTALFLAKAQYTSQDNKSDKAFRNISKQYTRFIPEAGVSYYNRIIGERKWSIDLDYTTDTDIPSIDMLAPFVDSTLQYQYYLGNRNLKAAYEHNLALSYAWAQETTYPLRVSLSVKASATENYISDSSLYNSAGIRISYPVNVKGYKEYGSDFRLAKAFVVNKKQLTYSFSANATSRQIPLYVNNKPFTSLSNSFSANSELGYSYSSVLGVYFLSSLSLSNSKLNDNSSASTNTVFSTGLEAVADLINGIHFNTSTKYISNKFNSLPGTNFLIWNAGLSYRLGAKGQYELKFNANDILNQSQGIRNTVTNNTVTTRTTNSLRQYFLFGLAFYPRFFGGDKR